MTLPYEWVFAKLQFVFFCNRSIFFEKNGV